MREDSAVADEMMRQRIPASPADPRPDIPAGDVFARLRAFAAASEPSFARVWDNPEHSIYDAV
jgi:hypothetical protein